VIFLSLYHVEVLVVVLVCLSVCLSVFISVVCCILSSWRINVYILQSEPNICVARIFAGGCTHSCPFPIFLAFSSLKVVYSSAFLMHNACNSRTGPTTWAASFRVLAILYFPSSAYGTKAADVNKHLVKKNLRVVCTSPETVARSIRKYIAE